MGEAVPVWFRFKGCDPLLQIRCAAPDVRCRAGVEFGGDPGNLPIHDRSAILLYVFWLALPHALPGTNPRHETPRERHSGISVISVIFRAEIRAPPCIRMGLATPACGPVRRRTRIRACCSPAAGVNLPHHPPWRGDGNPAGTGIANAGFLLSSNRGCLSALVAASAMAAYRLEAG
jgi:hypothetical protein